MMTEAQLLLFIEKLIPKLPAGQILIHEEISRLSSLVNHKVVIDKLVELGLIQKTDPTYYILTQKGKELKQVKRFHKLKKYQEKEKEEKSKSKIKKIYMAITLVVFIYGIVTEIQNYNLKSSVEKAKDSLEVLQKQTIDYSKKIDSLNRELRLEKKD